MSFLVITSAPTLSRNEKYVAYAPYVREMDVWFKYSDNVTIISPTTYNQSLITQAFIKQPRVVSIPSLKFTSFYAILKSILKLPIIFFKTFIEVFKADHIHLRCPGNIGLLGCLIQICFPKKIKTAKYAGNWDLESKQPLSYRFQKWILRNTFLTKNIKVLVYGNWDNQTKNIKPFFTASFKDTDKQKLIDRVYTDNLKFVFIGSLVEGKRPLLTIQIVENLKKLGKNVTLDIFGDGVLKGELDTYLTDNNLNSFIRLHGNKNIEELKERLKTAHFLILPSKSEGWPKAIAEAMFFGAIPIATSISCVPYMLDYGKRGILIKAHLEDIVNDILSHLEHVNLLSRMSVEAANWSQNYTLDKFDREIKKILM